MTLRSNGLRHAAVGAAAVGFIGLYCNLAGQAVHTNYVACQQFNRHKDAISELESKCKRITYTGTDFPYTKPIPVEIIDIRSCSDPNKMLMPKGDTRPFSLPESHEMKSTDEITQVLSQDKFVRDHSFFMTSMIGILAVMVSVAAFIFKQDFLVLDSKKQVAKSDKKPRHLTLVK